MKISGYIFLFRRGVGGRVCYMGVCGGGVEGRVAWGEVQRGGWTLAFERAV